MKFYGYRKCSTCRQAESFLQKAGVHFEFIDITEHPPSKTELKQITQSGGLPLKKFFNTSGQLYREMALKDKIDSLSEDEAFALLSAHGKLIKRPLAFDGKRSTVGFREDEYRKFLSLQR